MKFAVVLTGLLLLAWGAQAKVLGNVEVASNYLWRGETRTDDESAVSGGTDYFRDAQQGPYLGLWTSNLGGNGANEHEVDLYLGYRTVRGEWRADLGYRWYIFPKGHEYQPGSGLVAGTENDSDFAEIYLGLGRGNVDFRYWHARDYFSTGHVGRYAELGWTVPLGQELSLRLHVGVKESEAITDVQNRVSDYSVSLHKEGFSLLWSNLADNKDARQSDNARVVVAYRHELTLWE